jgi:REP element-mobilizing transposase RayT
MSRPLRIEFPGAVYHVTSRGDRRESIFADDEDRVALLAIVEQGLEHFDAKMLAYCLIGNDYRFVLHTRSANLSLLMMHINGVHSQRYNRRHGLVGHLLQGRFKAILVDRELTCWRCAATSNSILCGPLWWMTRPIGHGRATEAMRAWPRAGHGWTRRACTRTCLAAMAKHRQTLDAPLGGMRSGWRQGAMCGCGTTH